MEIDIEDFISALTDYTEASAELKQMQGEYQRLDGLHRSHTGYSPGYHLASWYEAKEKAKKRLKETLDAYIDARVGSEGGKLMSGVREKFEAVLKIWPNINLDWCDCSSVGHYDCESTQIRFQSFSNGYAAALDEAAAVARTFSKQCMFRDDKQQCIGVFDATHLMKVLVLAWQGGAE